VRFDYSKLRGKIREVFGTQNDFAKAMGFSNASLSAKLNGKVEFGQNEIGRALSVLQINGSNELYEYFFTCKV